MKRSIFDEQTSKALMQWHKNALKKKDGKPGPTPTRTLGDPSDSPQVVQSPAQVRAASGLEMSNSSPTGQSAHIVASVDIPAENPAPGPNRRQASNTDLLL